MKRDYSLTGLKVGITVFIGLILLLVVVFLLGERGGMFEEYYELKARFPKVNGLVIGSPVWLSGVDVGYVSDIRFPEKLNSKELVVVMKIKKKYQKYIRSDSKAFIETKGLLGNKIITIYIGSSHGIILKNGDFIPSVPPLDITEFVSGATASLRNLQKVIEDLKNIGNAISEGEGSIGLLIKDKNLYTQLVGITRELKNFADKLNNKNSTLGQIINNRELYDNVNQVVVDMRNGKGVIPQLLHNPAPFDKINSILAKLDKIVDKINKGNGVAGKMVNDERAYQELLDTLRETQTTLKEVQRLIKDIKSNPQKYFRIKVF